MFGYEKIEYFFVYFRESKKANKEKFDDSAQKLYLKEFQQPM